MDSTSATRLGDFRLERELGRGGMGVVYLAEEVRLGRHVALKLIAPDLAEDADFRHRFEREARIAAGLDHPNVVPLFAAGEVDGHLYLSMRYVEGTDLKSLLVERGRLDYPSATSIVAQVGSALDAAHARGLVHRDVKPANILLGRTSEGGFHAYLTDFGITKDSSEKTVGLTQTGQWIGTVDYVSPEQLSGEPIDARSDVYSLGCVLYQALVGHAPYQGADVHKVYAHVHEPPPSLRDEAPELAPAFDPVIQRAMAKNPAERYPSAGDLGRAAHSAAVGELNTVAERTVAAGEAATGIAPTAVAAAELAATQQLPPPQYPPPPSTVAPQPQRSRRGLWIGLTALAIVLVAAVAALAVVALTGNDNSGGGSSKSSSGSSKSSGSGSSSGGSSSSGASKGSSADRTFATKTDDLLARSKSSYDEVNDVFRRMQEVADGQSDAIEPNEAKSKLNDVIDNRTSLKAEASSLPASSSLAREVRSDLVAAFDASLVNDKDIETCIATGQATGPGELFSNCLSSTSSSSDAATNAKSTFKDSYNRLRGTLGLASVNPTF
ncbi:MAG: serine/threonine-protein kinase [Thermoleophilaceae bacterium]